jgi:hypothetical protein
MAGKFTQGLVHWWGQIRRSGGPRFKMEPVLRALGEYDLVVNKHQRRLHAGLGLQEDPGSGKAGR